MDKRVLVAAGLSVLILVLWGTLFPPPERETVPQEIATTEGEATEPFEAPSDPVGETQGEEPEELEIPPAEAIEAASAELINVQTDLYEIALTNEGGRATSWKLRQYLTTEGDPLELLPGYTDDAPSPLMLRMDDPALMQVLNGALYEVEREALIGGGERVVFKWSDGRGLSAEKAFAFRDGSYEVGIDVQVVDRGRSLPAALTLGPGFGAQEPTSSYYYEAWVRDRAGEVVHTQKNKRRGYSPESGAVAGDIRWAGLEDQYFSALVLPNSQPSRVFLDPVELTRLRLPSSDDEPEPMTEMIVSVSIPDDGATLYFGAKKYRLLQTLDNGLERVVWFFDIKFLAWISKQIYLGLLWLHDNTIANYGVAIVMATFLLRLMLFPLNQYSMVKMKKTQMQMSRLQPKIKAIKAKYKKQKDGDSRNKMNQEMMELYRKEGVNPMGGVTGCLPMLGQFPILIGFYGMLTVAVELRGAPFFGWIQDLSRSDPLWITPLLMGVTMFVQQAMAMSKVKDPVQQQQQRFMMIMPVVFTVICLSLPSGLVLYWFVNNVLGIGQQWLVNRHTGRLEGAAAETGGRTHGKAAKKDEVGVKPAKQGKGPQSPGKKKKAAR